MNFNQNAAWCGDARKKSEPSRIVIRLHEGLHAFFLGTTAHILYRAVHETCICKGAEVAVHSWHSEGYILDCFFFVLNHQHINFWTGINHLKFTTVAPQWPDWNMKVMIDWLCWDVYCTQLEDLQANRVNRTPHLRTHCKFWHAATYPQVAFTEHQQRRKLPFQHVRTRP